jgi:hypothetical protein
MKAGKTGRKKRVGKNGSEKTEKNGSKKRVEKTGQPEPRDIFAPRPHSST